MGYMKWVSIAVLAAVAAAVIWFIAYDVRPRDTEIPVAVETATPMLSPVSGAGAEPAGQLETPDLDRPIVVTADLTPENRKKYTEGIQAISRQLKNDRDSLDGWMILGLYRRKIGDYEGAAEAWEFLTKIHQGDARAFANLGSLYSQELKDYAKAEAWYRKSIEADAQAIGSYLALAEFYQYFTREPQKVVDTYLLGLRRNPSNLSMLFQLAYFYREQGEREKAIEYFTELLTQDPANANAKQMLEELKRG